MISFALGDFPIATLNRTKHFESKQNSSLLKTAIPNNYLINHCYSLFVISLCLSLLTFSHSGFASASGKAVDNARVIVVKADKFANIANTRISSYSLAAIQGGRLISIPFQFEERTESGYIYMKELDEKLKKKDPIAGQEGFFDADDELLFMLKDAGARRKSGMATDGEILSEIQVKTHDGQRSYVYLVKEARLSSDNSYVRYSSELGRVETDYYSLKVDPKNAFMWEEFEYSNFDGAHPGKPIDTIKVAMRSHPIIFYGIPHTFTNKNLVAKAIAETSGPIRSTTQYKLVITLLKLPALTLRLQIVHHEQEISYDARIDIPFLRRLTVIKPDLEVSFDGYDLYGALARVKNGPKSPGIVDGEMSDIENEIANTSVKAGESNWVSLDTRYGLTVFSNFNVSSEKPLDIEIVYEDNKNKKGRSEYYKGQSPNIGFRLPKIPLSGKLNIKVDLKMFSEEIDTSNFAGIVNKPAQIRVYDL